MKRKRLIIPLMILAFILTFTLLPVSFISASPDNLVLNGDFSLGDNGDWDTLGNVSFVGGEVLIGPTANSSWVAQSIYTSQKRLKFSFDVKPVDFGTGAVYAGYRLYKNAVYLDFAEYYYGGADADLPLEWTRGINFKISDCWADHNGTSLPDFDEIWIYVGIFNDCEAYFDNIKLEPYSKAEEDIAWVRTQEMTCKQVWINEDNMFQFSFIYPYNDNNWVRIYDMAGKIVYEIDMPYDNPNIIVDLPDGMYTVKTFNDQPEPIQTFVIGKP
jgi:hypothetical protein